MIDEFYDHYDELCSENPNKEINQRAVFSGWVNSKNCKFAGHHFESAKNDLHLNIKKILSHAKPALMVFIQKEIALFCFQILTKKSDRVFKVCGWHSQMILLWMI